MAKVRFNLKNPNAQTETLIFLVLHIGGKRLKYSTGEVVHPKKWNSDLQRVQNDKNGTNAQLNRYANFIETVLSNWKLNEVEPTVEGLRTDLDNKFKLPETHQSSIADNLNDFITQFIDQIATGKRLFNGKKYSPSTVKCYRSFQRQFTYFQQAIKKKLNFDDITIDLYDKLVDFFYSKNYSANTTGKNITHLKTIMRIAREEFGLHDNTEPERQKFKSISFETTEIYLNETELQKLYDLDLSNDPHHDVIRDVFLVGCYTALRYSDYSRINKTHIKTSPGGRKTIVITTKKTSQTVEIPIRPELDAILKKHNHNLPKTYEQKINKGIKHLGFIAGITEPVNVEKLIGGELKTETVPKYKLIKTHTARRSGATNMYKAGIPPISIMKITGHKTESSFLRYIKLTTEETAEILAGHEYFN